MPLLDTLKYVAGNKVPTDVVTSLHYIGEIAVAGDFPVLAGVYHRNLYMCTAMVTDNNPTKTNTGQSFIAYDWIYWEGKSWTLLGNNNVDTGVSSYINIYNSIPQSFTGAAITLDNDTIVKETPGDFTVSSGEITFNIPKTYAVFYNVTADVDHAAYQQASVQGVLQKYDGSWNDIPGSRCNSIVLTNQVENTGIGQTIQDFVSGNKLRVRVVRDGQSSKTVRTVALACSLTLLSLG